MDPSCIGLCWQERFPLHDGALSLYHFCSGTGNSRFLTCRTSHSFVRPTQARGFPCVVYESEVVWVVYVGGMLCFLDAPLIMRSINFFNSNNDNTQTVVHCHVIFAKKAVSQKRGARLLELEDSMHTTLPTDRGFFLYITRGRSNVLVACTVGRGWLCVSAMSSYQFLVACFSRDTWLLVFRPADLAH